VRSISRIGWARRVGSGSGTFVNLMLGTADEAWFIAEHSNSAIWIRDSSIRRGFSLCADAILKLDWGVARKAQALAYVLTWAFLVELPGIEPGSYGIPSRLLRAQFAMPLLGSPEVNGGSL
jgi:hypothetical protein